MRVLIIPEDFRKDQYMLKPIIKSLFRSIGQRNAAVRVCQVPLLGGVNEALKRERIHEILDRYRGMVDIFLLCIDRDGDCNRRSRLDAIENDANQQLTSGHTLIAENAWQELEVWVLAGLDLPRDWRWMDVRSEKHSKDVYFEPLAKDRGLTDGPGGGRKTLAEQAAQRFERIAQLCPEDVGNLKQRIAVYLELRD